MARHAKIPSSGCTLIRYTPSGELADLRAGKCAGWNCNTCGWEKDEIARRRNAIRAGGLTRRRDGLRTLVIGRRWST